MYYAVICVLMKSTKQTNKQTKKYIFKEILFDMYGYFSKNDHPKISQE